MRKGTTLFTVIALALLVAVGAGGFRMLTMSHDKHVCPIAMLNGYCPTSEAGAVTVSQHIQDMLGADRGTMLAFASLLFVAAVLSIFRALRDGPPSRLAGLLADSRIIAALSSPSRDRLTWSALHTRTGDIVGRPART